MIFKIEIIIGESSDTNWSIDNPFCFFWGLNFLTAINHNLLIKQLKKKEKKVCFFIPLL